MLSIFDFILTMSVLAYNQSSRSITSLPLVEIHRMGFSTEQSRKAISSVILVCLTLSLIIHRKQREWLLTVILILYEESKPDQENFSLFWPFCLPSFNSKLRKRMCLTDSPIPLTEVWFLVLKTGRLVSRFEENRAQAVGS